MAVVVVLAGGTMVAGLGASGSRRRRQSLEIRLGLCEIDGVGGDLSRGDVSGRARDRARGKEHGGESKIRGWAE
ncbi:hypothetical protein M0R45_013225 [Rubus argutus]|uniref:MHC class I antigen n=1 Tax=Rubus argutus TaxID=59490 RepID=A0AAW1XIE9_RUBAR